MQLDKYCGYNTPVDTLYKIHNFDMNHIVI